MLQSPEPLARMAEPMDLPGLAVGPLRHRRWSPTASVMPGHPALAAALIGFYLFVFYTQIGRGCPPGWRA